MTNKTYPAMGKIAFAVFAAFLVVCAAGCKPKNPAAEGLVPVSGVLTLDGTPVAGATITFHNTQDKTKPGGSCISKPGGAFSVNMFGEGDGTYPGEYKVTLSKTETVYPFSDEELLKMEQAGEDIPPGKTTQTFSTKYQSVDSTDILVTIPEKGTKELKIEATGT